MPLSSEVTVFNSSKVNRNNKTNILSVVVPTDKPLPWAPHRALQRTVTGLSRSSMQRKEPLLSHKGRSLCCHTARAASFCCWFSAPVSAFNNKQNFAKNINPDPYHGISYLSHGSNSCGNHDTTMIIS